MPKIVVLEDDYTLLDLYRDVLERVEYAVYPATTVQAVQEFFSENTADLVVADLRIGVTSAEETVQVLQQIREKHGTPMILISAQMMIYEEMCREAGFSYLLTKPFPNGILIQVVKEVLGA